MVIQPGYDVGCESQGQGCMVELLLDSLAALDVDLLYDAVTRGHVDMVNLLIGRGAKVDAVNRGGDSTVLYGESRVDGDCGGVIEWEAGPELLINIMELYRAVRKLCNTIVRCAGNRKLDREILM